MDGKPLYEYAREGKSLPRPIEPRECQIHHLAVVDWQDAGEHKWTFPEEAMEPELVQKMESLVDAAKPDSEAQAEADQEGPGPAFTIEMTVSSGTYVRCVLFLCFLVYVPLFGFPSSEHENAGPLCMTLVLHSTLPHMWSFWSERDKEPMLWTHLRLF